VQPHPNGGDWRASRRYSRRWKQAADGSQPISLPARSRLDLGGDGRRYMMAPHESVARLRETLHEMELVIGGRRAAQRDGSYSRLALGSISARSRLDLG